MERQIYNAAEDRYQQHLADALDREEQLRRNFASGLQPTLPTLEHGVYATTNEGPQDVIDRLEKRREALTQELDQIDFTIAEQYHVMAQESYNGE